MNIGFLGCSKIGTKVIEQSPIAGVKIDINSKIRLLLGE